jgi:hypothetical protein
MRELKISSLRNKSKLRRSGVQVQVQLETKHNLFA